ncbi:NADPH-dependent FMN reductase [Phytoactinopolyspora halotolerans]|uniref:NAD(P)H-dependent oxidoreductase n=1 Tax=Phytoactinopolyspora halotolerans TaxID=1981512 RepID=A0A6L9S0W3_9ACTN|nr:NAD(P)H-dependent oxidoreductase [Phytoactinopolyspora halotolerans]NED98795.1 NAD(P)H-dependent oxidoreductase [Phytoactinopolyspora halotolerans]
MDTIVTGETTGGGRTARIGEPPLRTAVIVGSTREGRAGESIARWLVGHAEEDERLDVDVVDLADFSFPSRYPRRPAPAMTEFASRVERADAFVVVTPEYNHGYPASLKQAIDYGCDEWFAKPAGFVAYGMSGRGLRAVEQLRQVFTSLHMVTVPDVVSFDLFDGSVVDGRPRDAEAAEMAARRMLDQLAWWAHALRAARAAHAYAA